MLLVGKHLRSTYLLLSLYFTVCEASVSPPVYSHQLNVSVQSVYESKFEAYFGQQRSIAILLRLKDIFLHWNPDVQITYANLTVKMVAGGFHFNCPEQNNVNYNSSLINSNLMGPLWNDLFTNLRHVHSTSKSQRESNRKLKQACRSMVLMLCDGVSFEDLGPLTQTILPLSFECQVEQIQIDISSILRLWYATDHSVGGHDEARTKGITFSLVIDELLLKSTMNNKTRLAEDENVIALATEKLDLNMEYVIDTRCFSEEVMEDEPAKSIKVCKFREYCPQTECGIFCDFEEACEWRWDKADSRSGVTGFQLTTGKDVIDLQKQNDDEDHVYGVSGPQADSQNDTEGHFLLLAFSEAVNKSAVYHLKSPWFSPSDAQCYLEALLHMNNMNDGTFKFLMHTQNHTTWVPLSKLGNNKNMWERLKSNIGRTTQPFHISLEVNPSSRVPSHIAVDNIRLVNCFPQPPAHKSVCSMNEFRCRNDLCIERSRVCDFSKDCLYGEDEENCDKMPRNTSCNFEKGWCGWNSVSEKNIKWQRTNKPSQTRITGPTDGDHTFNHVGNVSGYYLFVHMNANNSHILDKAMLRSAIFGPPPFYHQNSSSNYYKSCQLRFFYHMFGPHVGSLHVDVIEANPRFPKSTRLTAIVRDQGNIWHRESIALPKLDHLYYIEFVGTRGPRFAGDIALDDISLSPECVGQGVPHSELRGYSYENELNKRLAENRTFVLSVDMENVTKYTFTTCNNSGRTGPALEQCQAAYKDTPLNGSVTLLTEEGKHGVQRWTVPESNHYTFVAKGASGGRGAVSSTLTSSGSMMKVTLFLKKGEQIFVLVGQEGASACDQRNSSLPAKLKETCRENLPHGAIGRMIRAPKGSDAITELNRMSNLLGGGGGGGGATFVFKMEGSIPIVLLVAAGGGGLAYNALPNISPYGGGTNGSLEARSGASLPHGAGGGGGWKGEIIEKNMELVRSVNEKISRKFLTSRGPMKDNSTMWISAGGSLLDGGGIGGLPCVDSAKWGTEGGFGGGGGGCTAGGGGGGYVGGSAHNGPASNGEGGLSYITKNGLYPLIEPGGNDGPGSVVVIPSISGCGCDYRCVLLDEYRFHSACVCPESKILNEDGYSCSGRKAPLPLSYLIGLILIGVVIFASVGLLCIFLYNRYQRRKAAILRRKVLGGPELQLSRLRAASGPGGVLTEYNPNYEFGGETYSVADLKEIPRENLRLIKALGQGAFGEVYQGFYKHRAGDTVEMPVAVKTLPELSSNQAEMDFLMEALIMSKFNHPNIVHFIGVCFDKHPRFIILELLAGGDLKTFLRESRPKPERGSPLAMKDLLLCAIDVAKGCKYLEENHFIHRDIAARNCLLTSKGPGRVVKIADFGMARDIYRADYYKKGGKAMLPVKWMPPEAFLDGLFTSKTDVWSYGVLLWEVFSLGYMPYPGRGNQDVMQLVTNGGRLEPPSNCPPPVYGIMTQCWHPIPEERPTFSTLLERVGYCLQDPEVVNAPLPVFQRPPSSSERDTMIMRPINPDDQSCLRIVHRSGGSAASMNPASPNSSTADYLVPLAPYSFATSSSSRLNNGKEASVTSPASPPIPESESTQTLLEDEDEEGPKSPSNIYNSAKLQNQPSQVQTKKLNGIENGLTLNPANLDKAGGSRNPVPYANVGVKKPSKVDEEIRC